MRTPERYITKPTPQITEPQVHPITGEMSDASYDLAQVLELAKMGCSLAEIGRIVGAPYDTLRDEPYKEIIEYGRANLNRDLRKKQIDVAMSGDTGMLKWLGSVYLKQAAKTESVTKFDFSRLSDSELQRLVTTLDGDDPDQTSLFDE